MAVLRADPRKIRLTGDSMVVMAWDAHGPVDELLLLAPPGEYRVWPTFHRGRLVELELFGPVLEGPLEERGNALPVSEGDYICVLDPAMQTWSRSAQETVGDFLSTSDHVALAETVMIPGTEFQVVVAGPADRGFSDLWLVTWARGDWKPARVRLCPND
jgi:hypothetical protein